MNFKISPLAPGLYLVATPIGTARDITLRALDVLASADILAAEDTRTARKLMEIHGVPLAGRPLVAFHDHSGANAVSRLAAEIAAGKAVAYVSEAGTPLVADPGFELAREVAEKGGQVLAVPGASAVLAALSVAALPTDRFLFAGFLPAGKAQREAAIAELRDVPATLVFYESPKRVQEMLTSLRDVLGADRQAAVCRELTKRFEEVRRGPLGEVADAMAEGPARGEYVVVVGRAGARAVAEADVEAALREAMTSLRVKDAATLVAGALGLPRREVYQIALKLSEDQ
ncbi:MAG: 16S rRNA (cytidine(1402)-2'-O)-methyltransferase [Limimaricola sp.]|uniref:16S rRNA (cytidine(1402)-2'-O)-methyltransferase n=1 Tax=Limimaricola sp. TaxID=2211665 RepID=UPI001D5178E0|nr:16S rRNA (cytidine(1402)-2'-O)-methyltransferase [Limimaricola sp.]MBI1417731.1 16S rRNA (cytidine(1402)-2'-O)-methyltransferase [Limimaricola sp.]